MAYTTKNSQSDVRNLISARAGVTEGKMFGGIAFMVGGTWLVGVQRRRPDRAAQSRGGGEGA